MTKKKVKGTPIERLLRQMREKRKRDADKGEKKRVKDAVKARALKLKKEKKEAAARVAADRRALFKSLCNELDKEREGVKKAQDEAIKKARTEKRARIAARQAEAKEVAKVYRTEKKARIK
jgi:ClpP class serine protease